MATLPLYPTEHDTIWRLLTWVTQETPPATPYFYDNRQRGPRGNCIVQRTLSGRCWFEQHGERREVGPNTLMIFQWDEPTSYGKHPGERYVCQWVHMRGAGLAEHWELFRQRYGSVVTLEPARVGEAFDELWQAAGSPLGQRSTSLALATYRFCMTLFDLAHQTASRALTPVERAVEHLLSQPNLRWNVQEIADHFDCSREHLTRTFRKQTGKTPQQHLTEARVRRARQLLRDTDLPLRQIAEQSGFGTAHTLTRQMQRTLGAAPDHWRQQQRSGLR